jgi:glycine oxidase
VPDVLILGAGIVGCAVADELTRRGAHVTIVDPRGVGKGASQASAGMLAPFSEGRHDAVMLALGARSLGLYDGFVARLRDAGHEVPYSRGGSIDVAFDEASAGTLGEVARELAHDGVQFELLDRAALGAAEPALSKDTVAGLHVPAHGAVGVGDLVEALWTSAARRGARMTVGAATRVSPGHGTVRVTTVEGSIDAPHVVLAAGSWAGRLDLAGAPPLPVRPVRGQLLALGWRAEPLRHTVWGPGCYAVPWPEGTVLVGATVEEAGFDEVATLGGVGELASAMRRMAPGSGQAAFLGARVGLRPGTPDDRPILGRSTRIEGLVYATGHYRNGALLAPLTSVAVADLIEGRADDPGLSPCAPGRFGEY